MRMILCRDLKETLRRLNKGADKVADLSGSSPAQGPPHDAAAAASDTQTDSAGALERRVFRGGLMFCLKDVPAEPGIMRSTLGDFEAGLNGMVCGGEDFVSATFNNTLALAAFPSLQQVTSGTSGGSRRGAFYETLRKVCLWIVRHSPQTHANQACA